MKEITRPPQSGTSENARPENPGDGANHPTARVSLPRPGSNERKPGMMIDPDELSDAEVDEMLKRFDATAPELRRRIIAALVVQLFNIREKLKTIVETEGIDRGVIYLSNDGPTRWDEEAKCQVYVHENFSPLGDALIELYELANPHR